MDVIGALNISDAAPPIIVPVTAAPAQEMEVDKSDLNKDNGRWRLEDNHPVVIKFKEAKNASREIVKKIKTIEAQYADGLAN